MINFDVKHIGRYKELHVEIPHGALETSMMDDAEQVRVAILLLEAAEEILPDSYENEARKISDICMYLDGN